MPAKDTVKIEKDVPVPPRKASFKELLDQLEIGDSFAVPIEQWTSLRNAAANYNRRSEKHFSVRREWKKSKNGAKKEKLDTVRVWRVE